MLKKVLTLTFLFLLSLTLVEAKASIRPIPYNFTQEVWDYSYLWASSHSLWKNRKCVYTHMEKRYEGKEYGIEVQYYLKKDKQDKYTNFKKWSRERYFMKQDNDNNLESYWLYPLFGSSIFGIWTTTQIVTKGENYFAAYYEGTSGYYFVPLTKGVDIRLKDPTPSDDLLNKIKDEIRESGVPEKYIEKIYEIPVTDCL